MTYINRNSTEVLTNEHKKFLRGLAHDLKTIIWVGQNNLTENVLQEIENALLYHELIKVKIRVGDHEARDDAISRISSHTSAELVQRTGNVITLYRPNNDKPVIKLP